MRAYHMPSLPEIPLEHLHDQRSELSETVRMKLKILYSLDENTNFLARSQTAVTVNTVKVPIPGQNDIMTLGVVSIKEVIAPVLNSSPELFSDPTWDYSVYAKDVSEEDEPFVGHGLVSKIVSHDYHAEDEMLIPGRVCENFNAFNRSKTLEIRLKFAKVKNQKLQQQSNAPTPQSIHQLQPPQLPPQSQQLQPIQPKPKLQQPQLQQAQYQRRSSISQIRQQDQRNSKRKHENSTDTEDEDESPNTFIAPHNIIPSNLPKMNRFVNNNPAPKAVRTQSLPVFENMMRPPENSFPLQNFPVQSIARRIYMADRMNEKFANNSQQNEHGSSPHENPAQLDVSKRFAPDFMKSASPTNKKTEQRRKSRKVSTAKAVTGHSKKSNEIPEEHQVYQSCFNCKTLDAKGWKWNESQDLSKRGLLCSTCYNYLKDKGVMRPKKLFSKTGTTSTTPYSARAKANEKPAKQVKPISSSPASSTTPIDPLKISNMKPPSSVYQDSSDPLNSFDDLVGSDFDFQFGPLTDIDPLPQQPNAIEDKENVPPQQSLISSIKATRQSSFEKMLTKSFSGALPTTGASPNEWMSGLFHVNTEPTPKDATPKDSPKDSPKDITTCNTLPCNEESPEENTTQGPSDQTNTSSTTKIVPVPSSPFLSIQEDGSSSPNSVNNHSYWSSMGDQTRISSDHDELPSKNLNDQLIDVHENVFQN